MLSSGKIKSGGGGAPPFTRLRRGGSLLLLAGAFGEPDIAGFMEAPDSFFDGAEILKDSRTTRAGVFSHRVLGPLFLKRYNNKGAWHSARYLLRRSRAVRAFGSHLLFRAAGVPAPEPVAALEKRRAGVFPTASWLLTRGVPDALPALDHYKLLESDETAETRFVESVCRMLARAHNAGLSHGDMKLSNIYVSRAGGDLSYGLWDLDSARSHGGPLGARRRAAELARFVSSFVELGERTGRKVLPEPLADKVRGAYERESGVRVDDEALKSQMRKFA